MQLIVNPAQNEWENLIKRPNKNRSELIETVQQIIDTVKQGGDQALYDLNKKYGSGALDALVVSSEEIEAAEHKVDNKLKEAIKTAKQNIECFHSSQMQEPVKIETSPGVVCWRKSVPIEKVGLYIPGGTAPLFSTVLMLGIPAKLVGCKEIVLCSPAGTDGAIHPAILYAARLTGITKIIKVGGAQAIASLAYGTESVPSVYKIFGPGNQYVTMAKQLVQMDGVAIDMPAGPSEVCVYADENANASFVASDLLSQAEHGEDSQALLVCTSLECAKKCMIELDILLENLPRKDIAKRAIQNSRAIVLENPDEAMHLINTYAPEHLIINCNNAAHLAEKVINAGSVFIGPYSPESAGDYASGTNHTLPTNGYAKAYSGVSLDSFVKKITFQHLSFEGLNSIGDAIMTMAESENLQAHAQAVNIRLKKTTGTNSIN